ncbi:MAG: hypothetical protein QXT33_01745 [Thermofilum sp.]|uniref:Uncharacterized protein n=1 Tax=Thermofilum pendens TaxID=2269 RepID=A0A7C4D497_THEPE
MEHRVLELAEIIVELAARDAVNNVGRVLIEDLIAKGYSREEVTEALKVIERRYRVSVVGDYIKVFLSER